MKTIKTAFGHTVKVLEINDEIREAADEYSIAYYNIGLDKEKAEEAIAELLAIKIDADTAFDKAIEPIEKLFKINEVGSIGIPGAKAEIKGVPSSKEFKKLQKDNAKLAKRVKELEASIYAIQRSVGEFHVDKYYTEKDSYLNNDI